MERDKLGRFVKGCIPYNKGKEHSIAKFNPQVFKKGQRPWNKLNLNEEEVIKLYSKKKLSPRKICKIFNCSFSVVYDILKKNKILKNNRKDYQKNNLDWYEKVSKTKKKMWKNLEYRNKNVKAILKGLPQEPNKLEKVTINLIQQNNLNFIYVGNGEKIIDGFNPDFIHKSKKIIIEVNGNYWHSLPKMIKKDKRKLKAYKKNGFNTIVIWEKELKNPIKVINKIRSLL